jgi:hypothetical protein
VRERKENQQSGGNAIEQGTVHGFPSRFHFYDGQVFDFAGGDQNT